MSAKMPPVPPENRSPRAPAQDKPSADTSAPVESAPKSEEKGRHANIRQNTTHQGYQQDR